MFHFIVKKIKFWLKAANSKGHGTHSPFVYDFIINVLNDERSFYFFNEIENIKPQFNNKKINELLFKMVNYYNLQQIAEVNCSTGITTCYLASANNNATIFAFEINKEYAIKFNENINVLELKNINLFSNDINENQQAKYDFVVINNVETINELWLNELILKMQQKSFIVFNKIHCNTVTESIWNKIKKLPNIITTIDLFDIGIIVFNNDAFVKQHFDIRY